jgi:serine/threonine protein kinase
MVPQTSCPEPRRWRGLLEGTLPEPEQAELNAHLETCADCQQTLEGLAAEGESWLAAVRDLDPVEESRAEPALRQALEELQGDLGRITTQAQTTGGEEIALDFLAPSAKPGVLGRLDHYDVLAVVGRGGMGVVLKAFDDELQRVVAIKVMAPPLAATASARKRFRREAQAAAAVRNEHIIDIHAVDEVHDLPYLVMEYVNGISLQEQLDQSGPLELKEVLRIGMQTAAGLDKAHAQGLIHRDIKPANILLENGVQRVKITDFGLARAVDDASLTQSGVIAGTPQYMAPEQARGEAVDHRADLFSLGSVLYAMCTGRPPFRASSVMAVLKRVSEDTPRPVREINPEVPKWLCAIIDKLHAKDPEDRFQSANEVAELLEQHLAHLQQPSQAPMPAPVVLPAADNGTPRRRLPRWLLPVAGLLLVLPLLPYFYGESVVHFVTNKGELILETEDPALEVTVLQNGSIIRDRSTQRRFVLDAGENAEIRVAVPETDRLLFRKDFAIRRGGKTRISIDRELAMLEQRARDRTSNNLKKIAEAVQNFKPTPLEWNPGQDENRPQGISWSGDFAAPAPASRTRRFAPPKDVPITQDGVTPTADADGWKIENTDYPKRTVRLFEVRDLDVKDCRLVFRVQMKTETKEKLENRRIFTRLETAFRPKVTIKTGLTGDTVTAESWSDLARRGNTSWAQEEATTNCRSQPEVIALNLLVEGIGTIWIKDVELIATPLPAKVGGERTDKLFALLPRAGGAEQEFATLSDAVAAANDGDTIEVRGDGPFASEPIHIAGKALTIRAGGGFQPVINLQPKEGKIKDPLLETDSPLVLEGLALQRLETWQGRQGHPERNGLVLVWKAPIHAANCRFLTKTSCVGIWAIESSVCDLRNCTFGGPNLHAAVDWTSPPRGALYLENCLLLAGPHGLVIHQKWADAEGSSVRLTHNTLSANVLLEYWLWTPIQDALAQVKDPAFRIEAKANLFDTPGHVLDFKQIDQSKPLTAKEAETALPRLISWRERRNIYPAKPHQLLLLSSAGCGEVLRVPASPSGVGTTAEWGRYWGDDKNDAVPGMLRYQGGNVGSRAKSDPEQIRPTDFRLRNDSAGKDASVDGRDLGADVDLVGPGPAYERWKKTSEYPRWLKDTGQVKE